MAKKVKVQDGKIAFSSSDPTSIVDFDINGQLVVTRNIAVGNGSNPSGVITTSPGQNLTLTPGAGSNLILRADNALLLNGKVWPGVMNDVTPGSFLGASALNSLEFYSFTLAFTNSDTLTVSQLNAAYPTIQPGQNVVGPTVIYQCVGTGTWRVLGPPTTSTVLNVTDITVSNNIVRSVATISANGTDQSTATPMFKDINVVGSALGSGVLLPPNNAGLTITVINATVLPINVYPQAITGVIDVLSPAAPFILPAGSRILFTCVSPTQWYTLNATYS